MIKAVKKDTGNIIYMRLKKHNCPVCDKQMKVIKMTKVVKAKTKEGANFDFKTCDLPLGEKVKFIWYEFKCRDCGKQYTENDMRRIEKEMKKKAAKESREAKKAAKLAEKQAKNNPQSEE